MADSRSQVVSAVDEIMASWVGWDELVSFFIWVGLDEDEVMKNVTGTWVWVREGKSLDSGKKSDEDMTFLWKIAGCPIALDT
ncbi:hypothetical protein Q3G72_007079 [Acer saccharum]|nr:hypothetical protein Q3G72_007079 [Acer saccharum]